MKKQRKMLSFLLVLALLLSLMPTAVFAAESEADAEKVVVSTVEDLPTYESYYEITSEQLAAAPVYSGTIGENATYTLDPSTGELVVAGSGYIGTSDANFESLRSLIKKVYVESGITCLGDHVFKDCENLTEVYLPNGLTEIGWNAFKNCASLKSITLPESVTLIYSGAFCGCASLKHFVVPESNPNYTAIDGALYSKDGKKLICFPAGCGVVSYTIPDSVEDIWEYAFSECTSLENVTVSAGVTEIGHRVFENCTNLKNVTLSDTVSRISYRAFFTCTNLKEINIPESVLHIDYAAFDYCTNLKNIYVDANNEAFEDLDGVLFSKDKSTLKCYPAGHGDSYAIPAGTTEIDYHAFFSSETLNALTLPSTLTTMGYAAIDNCPALTSITVPATVNQFWGKSMGYLDASHFEIENGKMDSFEITGHTDSAAETYAEEYGFTFRTVHFYDDGVVTKAATCEATGVKTYTCTACEATKTEKIAATGHSWDKGTVTKEPTATEKGERTYTCKNCGRTKTEAIAALGCPFTDLVENSSYYNAVLWAVDKGITKGTSATEFSPKADCTRAQIVTFLWRYAGSPEPGNMNHNFVDIVEGSSYYKAVLWAVEKGITTGMDKTHFGPKEPCTRAQIVTFLWRAAGKPQPSSQKHSFTDIVKGSSYYDAVLWAVEKGITTGADSTHFNPKATCTRAQGMTFLYRYNNKK